MNNLENLHKINQYSNMTQASISSETVAKSPGSSYQHTAAANQLSNPNNNILNRFHSHDQHNLKQSELTAYDETDERHANNVKKHQINDTKNIDDLARSELRTVNIFSN